MKNLIFILLGFCFVNSLCLCQTSGSYDINFEGNGKKFIDFNGAEEEVFSVGLQNTGRIVAALNVKNSGSNQIFITRYFPDGSLDNSFGIGGGGLQILTSGNNGLRGRAMSIAEDGSIFIAGWRDVSADIAEQFVYKLDSEGELDQSFGTNGQSIFFQRDDGRASRAEDITLTDDGKILVCGLYAFEASIARLLSNGDLDNSFSFDGKITINPDNGRYSGMKTQSLEDGNILFLFQDDRCFDFNVVRFKNNGQIENSFGDNGIASVDISGESFCPDGSLDLPENMVVHDDKIYIVGSTSRTPFNNRDGAIVRLKDDGTLDNSFSFDGIVKIDNDSTEFFKEIVPSSDGTFFILGTSCFEGFSNWICTNSRLNIIKFNEDGTLFSDFGNNGIISELFTERPINVLSSELQNDGRLLFAGQIDNDNQSEEFDGFIFRINTDILSNSSSISIEDHCNPLVYPTLISSSQSEIRISLECDQNISIQEISLIDAQGLNISSISSSELFNTQVVYPIPSLPAGMYWLRIQTSMGMVSKRILKIN